MDDHREPPLEALALLGRLLGISALGREPGGVCEECSIRWPVLYRYGPLVICRDCVAPRRRVATQLARFASCPTYRPGHQEQKTGGERGGS